MKTFIRFSLLALASCAAMAQTTSPVAQSVQKAIEGNPEVAAKFNAFRASNDQMDVAAGNWRPHHGVVEFFHGEVVGGATVLQQGLLTAGLVYRGLERGLGHAQPRFGGLQIDWRHQPA